VAEACSGIRYLIPLGFTALVSAYLFDPKPWMRAAVLAAAVPLAIFANAIRVAAVAYVPALDSGFAHTFTGWLLFMFCLAALVVVRRMIHGVYALSHR
jgi:exosortase/archaeosortase family protein